MNVRSILALTCLSVALQSGRAQTPAPPPTPTFLAADIHPAPHRTYPFFFATLSNQNRYTMRDATLVDLIATAWKLDRDNVQGGPGWVDWDRFDITAAVPPGTSNENLRLMLRDLLATRFGLTTHTGSKAMPAFVLSVGAGKPKLAPGTENDPSSCDDASPKNNTGPSYNWVVCKNMTLDDFAQNLHNMAGGYLTKPVVNDTKIEGTWNYEIHWTSRNALEKQGPDGISVFDAVQKQLGLKLALETSPRPVVLIDTASEAPTPNRPDLAKILPPQPPPEFEVATIKPSKPGTRGNGRITPTGLEFANISLKDLISLAWDLNQSDPEVIVDAPKWLDDDKFDITAKVAQESGGRAASPGGDLPMDIYELEQMLRALLIERFSIKAHMEDRPINAYTLLAAGPKMKPADPSTRSACHEGPGADGKDPRITSPILNRLLTCQNINMKQMGEELQHLASGYIYAPVADSTGLKGGYDFTLSFSSADRVLPNARPPSGDAGSDPNGALSLFDALPKQVGLKLEKQKRLLPVLVLEHIEEKPTDN